MTQRKILLISENEINIQKFTQMVKTMGYAVEATQSPQEINPAKIGFDLVVADTEIILAKKSNVIKRIKTEFPNFPLVASFSDLQNSKNAIELLHPADAFIDLPPTDVESIRKIVVRFVEPIKTGQKFRVHSRKIKNNRISWNSAGSSIHREGEIRNIGRGGVFVKGIGVSVQRREVINFALKNPVNPTGSIKGVGVVRWICTPGMSPLETGFGLEFVSTASGLNQLL